MPSAEYAACVLSGSRLPYGELDAAASVRTSHAMDVLQQSRLWFASFWQRIAPAPGPRFPALSPVVKVVERSVRLLDGALPIPGTRLRIGLDPLLGFALPAVGDAVAGFISLGVLLLAVQYRVPTRVLGRMVWNVAIDTAVGSVPIAGDLFDFVWKSNERNFELLMQHRGDLPKTGTLGYWSAVTLLLIAGLTCLALPIALVIWLAHWYLRG